MIQAEQGEQTNSAPLPYPPGAQPSIDWRLGFASALFAGGFMALMAVTPFLSLLCCLWLPLGGALSVRFYIRKAPPGTPVRGLGARLGALAGFLGFFIFCILQTAMLAISRFLLHQDIGLRKALVDALETAQKIAPNPDAPKFIAWVGTPEGLAIMIAIWAGTALVAFLVFGVIGGALGARYFQNRSVR